MPTFEQLTGADLHEVREFQHVLLQDYLRVTDVTSAQRMAYGMGDSAAVDIEHGMAYGPREYYGLWHENKLGAVASFGSWLYGDQAPFVSRVRTEAAKLRHRLYHRMGIEPTKDAGVFAFGVDATDKHAYEALAGQLLSDLRDVARDNGKRQLRMAVDASDEYLLGILENMDEVTQLTNRLGRIGINGVQRDHFLIGITTE